MSIEATATDQSGASDQPASSKAARVVFDKPSFTIIRLVIGGIGIVGALTGAGVPSQDLNAAYFDANPFAAKAQVIREYLAFWFAMVVAASVSIHIATEIWEPPSRTRSWRYYAAVFTLMLLGAIGLSQIVIYLGKSRARSVWYPQAVTSMMPAYRHARALVERNGVEPTDLGPISKEIRSSRLSTAERDISQIERLLDMEPQTGDLPTRVRALSTIFDSQ